MTRRASRLRLRLGALRARAAIGHELVELGAVLGEAQALEELDELALLLLEPAQGLYAICVEGAIAACRAVPTSGTREPVRPIIVPTSARVRPTAHASAPYEIGEDEKPDRPIGDEAQDHEGNPDRLRHFIELRGDIHDEPHVNVSHIYMRHYGRIVKVNPRGNVLLRYFSPLMADRAAHVCSAALPISPSPSK